MENQPNSISNLIVQAL